MSGGAGDDAGCLHRLVGAQTRAERAAEVQAKAGAIARTAVTLLDEHFASIDAIASTLARVIRSSSLDAGASVGTLRRSSPSTL